MRWVQLVYINIPWYEEGNVQYHRCEKSGCQEEAALPFYELETSPFMEYESWYFEEQDSFFGSNKRETRVWRNIQVLQQLLIQRSC